ncbi:MAG: preprotein translocase subunit SecG [Firmicutes bacterium]|nr:preprotein translocase subunit SecG [Bacillota bacterium]
MFFNTVINAILWFAQAGVNTGGPMSPASPAGSPAPLATPVQTPIIPAPQVSPSPISYPVSSGSQGLFHYVFLLVYFLVCAGLVVAVLLQTTKSEGLTGTIGGSTQSIFKGKMGMEEQLNRLTTYLAVGFVVISLLISFFGFR